jgi:hypothetical protein
MDRNDLPPASAPACLAWLPLAGAVSAQSLQEHLPGRSGPEVLARLGQWLEELVEHEQYPLQRWIEAIEQIDRLAQLHQFRLVPQQLEPQRLQSLCASELWQSTMAYWQQRDEALLHCLLRANPARSGRGSPIDLAPVLSSLMSNLSRQYKILLLSRQQVDERIWRDLGHAYLLAESRGLVDVRPRQEMLKVLMLAMAAPDALPPIQQHLAERITAHLAGHFAFGNQPGPACSFSFDLTLRRPPTRQPVDSVSPETGRLRFFGAGSAMPALQDLSTQLSQRGSLQRQIALGGDFLSADILATVQHLSRHWADLRPARREEREVAGASLTVLPGLLAALGWLARQKPDETLEPPSSPKTEYWQALDRSQHGFGAMLPDRPADWLTVGALVALWPEAGGSARMGVVRRVSAAADDSWRTGVELLGQQALRVTLHPYLPRFGGQGQAAGQAAILLSQEPDRAELLLPAGVLEHADGLLMQAGGRSYRIESPATVMKGRDYRLVRYCRA